jgi:oligopeptide/dipeptide ABC transporter ATP-binding protein
MIALAVACEPDILIADEPTTALDVTIQAQILHLLSDLQRKLNNSLIMITHDLGVVASIADEVIVMYSGRVIERGDVFKIFGEPKHPYTRGLIDSVIRLDDAKDEQLSYIKGSALMPLNKGVGCPFRERCKEATHQCGMEDPELERYSDNHDVACHVIEKN